MNTKTLDNNDYNTILINNTVSNQLAGNVTSNNWNVLDSTTLGNNPSTDVVTVNSIATFNGLQYFNNNIIANSNTVAPSQIGYLSNITSDVQTQISNNATNIVTLQTKTQYITNNLSGSTLVSNNLCVSNSKLLGLFNSANQYASLTLNSIGNLIITSASGQSITINSTDFIINSTTEFQSLLTANGGITIPVGQLLNLVGSINCNSQTITPLILSYLSGATSNLQTQLTTNSTNTATNTTNITALQTATTNLTYGSTGGHATTFLSNYLDIKGGSQIHFWNSTNTYYTAFGNNSDGSFTTNTNASAYPYTISSSLLNVSSPLTATGLITASAGITIPTGQTLSFSSITNLYNSLVLNSGNYIKLWNTANTLYSGITPNTDGSLVINTFGGLYQMNLGASLLNVTAPLTVSGATILSSTVAITGTTQCNSTLTVVGNSNLSNTYVKSGNSLFINDTANLYPTTFSVGSTGILNITPTSTITISTNTAFNGGLTLPTGKVFTVVGNLLANASTVTPSQLGYLSNVSSDIQTQISGISTTIQGTSNTWGALNTFSNFAVNNGIASTIVAQPSVNTNIGYISSISTSGVYGASGTTQYVGGTFTGSTFGVYLLSGSISFYSLGATATNVTIVCNHCKGTTAITGTNLQTYVASFTASQTLTFNLPTIPVYVSGSFTPNISVNITFTSTGTITIPSYNIFYVKLI